MEILTNLNWTILVPLIIALTAAFKDLGVFKSIKNEIVNLIIGLVVVGLVYLTDAIGFNWMIVAPFEAMAVIVINPVIYDKIIKPLLDFFKGRNL